MLNLFLAILLQNFEEPPGKSEEEMELEKENANAKPVSYTQLAKDYICCCFPGIFGNESTIAAVKPNVNPSGDVTPSKNPK